MIIFNKKRDIRKSYIPLSAVGQNRTVDTRIFSPLLYRLSYNGKITRFSLSILKDNVKHIFGVLYNLFLAHFPGVPRRFQ